MVHLIKLSVGSQSVEALLTWQAETLKKRIDGGGERALYHRTRSTPKRRNELLKGGSIYWVIAGKICLRQKLIDIRNVEFEGIKQCQLVFSPEAIRTENFPFRAFQGWRYLERNKAPRDLSYKECIKDDDDINIQRELKSLGLLN